MPRRKTVLDATRFLGERHLTPLYYNHGNGPYPTPWTWHPETKTMDMDFTLMNEALNLLGQLDIKYLFIAARYRVQLNRGAIYYYVPETKDWVFGWHGTKQGELMMRAWLKPVYENLRKKGWAAHTLINTNDKSWGKRTNLGEEANVLLVNYSHLIHEVAPVQDIRG